MDEKNKTNQKKERIYGKNRNLFPGVALVAVMLIVTMFAGCLGGESNGERRSISITGSTTLVGFVSMVAESYMDDFPNDDVLVSGGGSSVGVTAAAEGTADIGMSSRELRSSELTTHTHIVVHVVAVDGLSVIFHTTNPVNSLTMEQVKGIYNGTYTNWNQVGGNNQTIVVIGRDSASGTRAAFDEMVLGKENPVAGMLEKNSNGAVHDDVKNTPAAIGYVGLGYLSSDVKAASLGAPGSAVAPTEANVVSGAYGLARNMNLMTSGQPTGLAKDFIDYMMSPKGQAIIQGEGFVPVGPIS